MLSSASWPKQASQASIEATLPLSQERYAPAGLIQEAKTALDPLCLHPVPAIRALQARCCPSAKPARLQLQSIARVAGRSPVRQPSRCHWLGPHDAARRGQNPHHAHADLAARRRLLAHLGDDDAGLQGGRPVRALQGDWPSGAVDFAGRRRFSRDVRRRASDAVGGFGEGCNAACGTLTHDFSRLALRRPTVHAP
jgi:hypothetical protein